MTNEKLPNGMTKTEMLESLKSYTDFPEVIDEAIDAMNKSKSNKYLINNNPTNGDNNVENKIKYKEHSEDIVELEDANNTMISIHDLVTCYNQIQIMKSEGIYPEDMEFYFSCECEINNESEDKE